MINAVTTCVWMFVLLEMEGDCIALFQSQWCPCVRRAWGRPYTTSHEHYANHLSCGTKEAGPSYHIWTWLWNTRWDR